MLVESGTTKAEHVPARLRYANLVPPGYNGQVQHHFPFHRELGGEPHYWVVRRDDHHFPGRRYCLDVAALRNGEFVSAAWADLQMFPDQFGEISSADNFYPIGAPWVHRPVLPLTQRWGIFTAERFRRQGIGSSLITAARILTRHNHLDTLRITEIRFLESEHPTGAFYQSFKPELVDVQDRIDIFKGESGLAGTIALPAHETPDQPYRIS